MENSPVLIAEPELVIELIEKIEIEDGIEIEPELQENKENKENAEVTNVSYEETCYYGNAKTYWSKVEPTVDGMLGLSLRYLKWRWILFNLIFRWIRKYFDY